MGDTYEALPPVANTIVIGGEAIDLTPIKVGELPAFSRAIQSVVAGLSDSQPDWILLISEHGDAVIDAVAIATRRPREWVAGLDLDDAVSLADAVFEVNADFFIRRLLPSINKAAARIEVRIPGLMRSNA